MRIVTPEAWLRCADSVEAHPGYWYQLHAAGEKSEVLERRRASIKDAHRRIQAAERRRNEQIREESEFVALIFSILPTVRQAFCDSEDRVGQKEKGTGETSKGK